MTISDDSNVSRFDRDRHPTHPLPNRLRVKIAIEGLESLTVQTVGSEPTHLELA
jgi:hypothetical protein